ncbi:MAG: hypothetical protein FWD76_04405 [Firmicutes bacterium]|nr:hypothetical protein [Bacillota bacterium]
MIDATNIGEDAFSVEFYNRVNRLYKQLKSCDHALMNTESVIDDDNEKIYSAYLFSISSYGLSFISNIYMSKYLSVIAMMDIRCLIENIALYYHFLNGEIDKDGIALFKLQPYLLEYKIYKKYKCFDFMFPNDMKQKYLEAKKNYKGKLTLDAQTLAKLLKSQIPFVGERETFSGIIEKTLSKTADNLYRQLSILIHPHDGRSLFERRLCEEGIENNPFVLFALEKLEIIFEGLPKGNEIQFGLDEERLHYLELSNAYIMQGIIEKLNELIKDIVVVAHNKGLLCLASLLHKIRDINWNYFWYAVFGYTEQGIIKWKVVVEHFAMIDYFLDNPYYLGENRLGYWHTDIVNQNIYGQDISMDYKNKCYEEYQRLSNGGASRGIFDKQFGETLGFLVDKAGNVPSINQLAKGFLDKVSKVIDGGIKKVVMPTLDAVNCQQELEGLKSSLAFGEMETRELPLNKYLRMLYEESQIMSHATGYLYFANTGVWMEGMGLGHYICLFTQYIFGRLLELFNTAEMKTKLNGKTFVNLVRNRLRDFVQLSDLYRDKLKQPKEWKPNL